jgi:phenylpyruvate tautomerase PptA (4-oxalocrotonate tautomerase family)
VCEDRTSLVQEIVNAELDASFDDPSKRTVVVIHDIVDKKWVVELQMLAWDRR